jgi:hypothetical protein
LTATLNVKIKNQALKKKIPFNGQPYLLPSCFNIQLFQIAFLSLFFSNKQTKKKLRHGDFLADIQTSTYLVYNQNQRSCYFLDFGHCLLTSLNCILGNLDFIIQLS